MTEASGTQQIAGNKQESRSPSQAGESTVRLFVWAETPRPLRAALIRHRGSASLLGHCAVQRLNLTVFASIAEVEHQANRQPDDQTQPICPAKTIDHGTADQNPGR